MKSLVLKRSVIVAVHKTSVSLEDAFWKSLREIAIRRDMTLSALLAAIDAERQHGNLSSAIPTAPGETGAPFGSVSSRLDLNADQAMRSPPTSPW